MFAVSQKMNLDINDLLFLVKLIICLTDMVIFIFIFITHPRERQNNNIRVISL